MESIEVTILIICWGLFLVVWGLGWVYNRVKGPATQTGPSIDYFSLILLVVVFLLYRFLRSLAADFAFHLPLWVQIVGDICLVLSTGLTLWSRFVLGTMWASQPETKVGHQLRTEGPYRISRHPIYTGLIGMLFGSILVSNVNLIVILAAVVVIIRLPPKIAKEEKLMVATFGEQYVAYRQQVPQIIPGMKWLEQGLSGARKE